MLPAGTRSDAFLTPLRIWSNTGTAGASKVKSFTRNSVKSSLSGCVSSRVPYKEDRAHEFNVEIDVDVSTTREGFSGLN
jgi:hypothetical protein